MAETDAIVEEKLKRVLDSMASNGFEVKQPVEVSVDENLPFMGYTSRQWQKHIIVVSGFATKSPMLEGLLTHELSHVYRNVSNHPSHNDAVLQSLTSSFAQQHRLTQDYEHQTLHQVINHIQDLYADDVAIKVLIANQNRALTLNTLGEFFLGWIKEEPVKSNSSSRDRWVNAGILLNNCFAVSNIQRRKVENYIQKVETLNGRFLTKIPPKARAAFPYFNQFMVNLQEEITEEAFRSQMEGYLDRVWDVTQTI